VGGGGGVGGGGSCMHRKKCTNTSALYKLRYYIFRPAKQFLSVTIIQRLWVAVCGQCFHSNANLHEYTTIICSISRVILYPLYVTHLQSVFQCNYVVVTWQCCICTMYMPSKAHWFWILLGGKLAAAGISGMTVTTTPFSYEAADWASLRNIWHGSLLLM
jgi:hypothetical protein